MLIVQPHPIDTTTGKAGLNTAFMSELPPREAVTKWAREREWGWFKIERGEMFRGCVLFTVRWPALPVRPGRRARPEILYRLVTTIAA